MAALVGLTVWSQARAGMSTRLLVVDCCCAIACLALLPWLLRRPPAAAVLLAVLAAVSPAATPPATLGTLLVAQRRPLRTALLVGLAGVVTHAIRGWWRPTAGLSYGWWLVLDVVAHAALVGIGALLRAQGLLVRSLRERAAAAEAEAGRKVAEARAAERTRIAREMHDVLAHRLSLLATHAGALEYRPDAPPERIAAAAGVVRAGVHEALEDLRQVIGVLREDGGDEAAGGAGHGSGVGRPDSAGRRGGSAGREGDGAAALRPQPVLADIPALVEESRVAGTPVRVFDEVAADARPPVAIGRTAYRVVQEALTNARKHAQDSAVTVRLTGTPGRGLSITVSNPLGPLPHPPSPPDSPPDPETVHPPPHRIPGSGTGLIGLAERARLAGGHLEHARTDGEFRLVAWLPWPE